MVQLGKAYLNQSTEEQMATRMETIKQKRAERQKWVMDKLKVAGHTALDAAAYVGVNPRTWRDWVAIGSLPRAKESLILEVLGVEEREVSQHFAWRPE